MGEKISWWHDSDAPIYLTDFQTDNHTSWSPFFENLENKMWATERIQGDHTVRADTCGVRRCSSYSKDVRVDHLKL